MGFSCGIVGLPNVGKSTLFNALSGTAAAQAANYPFCTVDPNTGDVAVPDPRLDRLSAIANSAKIIPTRVTFVDIAGLVRGAAKGEGLGNRFLGHIREVDAVVHVVRCFDDGDITHVDGKVDPLSDLATIETELVLADLESLERRIPALEKRLRANDKEAKALMDMINRLTPVLAEGHLARTVEVESDDIKMFKSLGLITAKPALYIANVSEDDAAEGNDLSRLVEEKARAEGAECIIMSARLEEELAVLDVDEQQDYLAALGLDEPALNRVIRAGYTLLDLITYFTVGPKETRAWSIRQGLKAPQAAGVIHTDFERGFIRAETIGYDDYIAHNGESGARDVGKLRLEGKDYVVNEGDVMHFRFAV